MTLLNFYGFAMAVIYVGAGMYILLSSNIFNFSNLQKFSFGSILAVYGLFRFYITLKKKRDSELNNDDED